MTENDILCKGNAHAKLKVANDFAVIIYSQNLLDGEQ